MHTFWQSFTLQTLPLYQWRSSSYLYQLVGLLQAWRSGSWLLQQGDLMALGLLGILFGLAPYVSTTLISILLIACIGFWALLTISDPREKAGWGFTPIHLTLLLYWGISVIATGLSPVRTAAIEGLAKLTLYLLTFVVMARVLRIPRLRSWLIGIYLHTALLVSCYGIRQWIFGAPPLATWSDPESEMGNFTRVYSFLGNPNLLASYLIPAVAYSLMAIFVWRGKLPKALAAVMAIVNTLSLVFTFSRGGWIGLVLALVIMGLLVGFWLNLYRKKWVLPAVLGGMGGFILLSVLFVPPVRSRVMSMFIGRGDSSNNFRLNVWTSVVDMIKARPVLGIGPGNDAFNKIYPLYARSRFTALSAYSVLLEICVETGLIGLFSFLWFLSVTFTQGIVQLRRLRDSLNTDGFWLIGAVGSMVGLLGQGLVDTVWYRPQVNMLWWLAVAIIASFYTAQPLVQQTATPIPPTPTPSDALKPGQRGFAASMFGDHLTVEDRADDRDSEAPSPANPDRQS
ncbi:IctB family putative bicarbonate transporter [Alkalinema sp. FACHB-956]|uniref:IctB family putative bicarbonate transporter n=1 Tax=Alkalinema sp. FACHB-956 TaxID=2692768 RepID=UPI001682540E|nr:IctB family putative bicarbonate transporter [Alkalinema sp. FACHB-956]MBD2329717.1 putative bicarbonate transporter, IctB family [Alkalinema sp. FACHB-956]